MDQKDILVSQGTNYKKMTRELLEASDLIGRIPDRSCKVGIKPNLVSPSRASEGATTHPEVVAGIIEYLQMYGVAHSGHGRRLGGGQDFRGGAGLRL